MLGNYIASTMFLKVPVHYLVYWHMNQQSDTDPTLRNAGLQI